MNNFNHRATAATILTSLLAGRGSLSTLLTQYKNIDEYGLLQELCFGSSRWFDLLDRVSGMLLSKPLKKKDTDIRCLIIVGLYQLRELSLPDYAVINETVNATRKLKKPWAKGLVNAVLRNYLRERDAIELKLKDDPTQPLLSHPQWFVDELIQQWPEQYRQILANNNLRPPMTLRTNLLQITPEQALQKLSDADISATRGNLANTAIYLKKPLPVTELPGFNEGMLSVQDEASQLVPQFLDLSAGLRVLDACAAPGGKTCHILESEHSLTECVALDIEQYRLERISENLERLQLQATLLAADASATDTWWDGVQFDRILLDAPCSASGIIRRHPDIKLLREPKHLELLAQTQQRLLTSLWPCLKPGGLFLYTTCSVLRQENERAIEEFLKSADNAKYERIAADWGVECSLGRQLLPGSNDGPDGFYYCLLRKIE